MMNGKKIIAILPAYNAEKTLERTVEAISKDIVDEIILVDDASTDNTYATAQKLCLTTFRHKKNRGYGANQKTCYLTALAAGADIAVMVHPDFQYDPSAIPELLLPLAYEKADAVFGSRMLIPQNALRGGMPFWKFIANIFLTVIENAVLHLHLSEYHSGFRAYNKKTLQTIPFELNSNGFVFDTEIIVQMKCAGLTIKEIPIATRYFPEASMIGFLKSLQYGLHILWTLLQYLVQKIHIKKIKKFQSLVQEHVSPCVQCGNTRMHVWKKATTQLQSFFSSHAYYITDTQVRHDTLYICTLCDCRFIDRTALGNVLQEHYAHQSLDTTYLKDIECRKKTFQHILAGFSSMQKKRGAFLDIGCGPGLLLSEAQKNGYQIYGIDLSPASVQYAQTILQLPHIACESFEFLDNQFPDEFFDSISALDVFEHVSDPARFLTLIQKKLKPDGVFCMTLLLGDSFCTRVSGKRWYALLPTHLQYHSNKALKDLCDRYGFTCVASNYYTRYLSLSSLIHRVSNRENLWIPSYLNTLSIPINFFDTRTVYLKKKSSY